MNPLVKDMLEATIRNDVETRLLEDLVRFVRPPRAILSGAETIRKTLVLIAIFLALNAGQSDRSRLG